MCFLIPHTRRDETRYSDEIRDIQMRFQRLWPRELWDPRNQRSQLSSVGPLILRKTTTTKTIQIFHKHQINHVGERER